MPHEKNCLSCGRCFTGNRKKLYCDDACRKHFDRNGPSSLTGLKLASEPDKSGQIRTTPRAGGSSVGNYAAKRGIDLLFQAVSDSMTPLKSGPIGAATTPTDTPLQIVTAGKAVKDPLNQLYIPEVVLTQPFASFLGKVSYPFKMLVRRLPGSGKSTFCMQLAYQLAAHQQVVYTAGEEALGS